MARKKTLSALSLVPVYLIFAVAFGVAGVITFVIGFTDPEAGFIVVLFSIPFLAVSIGFWCAIFGAFQSVKRIRKVLKHGQEGTGHFEGLTTGMSVNNVHHAKVRFSYRDLHGETHVTKSQRFFSVREYSVLESLGTFKIKYYGKWAVIDEDTRNISRAAREGQAAAAREPRRCRYCGTIFHENDKFCRSCGAAG